MKNLFLHFGAYLLLYFILVLIPTELSAQPENWEIKYFTTEDGLSSNHINCIIKDCYGFLWIGTENGLNRFDGYNFYSLQLPSGDPHPLSNIKILAIFEDKDSLLWIGSSNGLFRYNPAKPVNEIKQYQYFKKHEDLTFRSFQSINRIQEDKNGLLWMSCNDPDEGVNFGLRTFDKKTEAFSYITIDSSHNFEGEGVAIKGVVTYLKSDSKGEPWLGTDAGLAKYDFEDKSFKIYKPSLQYSEPGADFVISIFEDKHSNLWISNNYGFSLFNPGSETFGDFKKIDSNNWWIYGSNSVIYAFAEDQNGYVWMRGINKIYRFKPWQEGIIAHESIEGWHLDYTTVEINPLHTLYIENPWVAWLGVPDRGLCQVNVRRNEFRTIKPTSLHRSGVIDLDYVNSIGLDREENLWMAWIDPGAIKIDRSNNKSEFYEVLPGEFGHGINMDQYENLWFSSRWGTASKTIFDENNEISFKPYYHNPDDPLSITRRIEEWQKLKGGVSMHMYEHLQYTDRHGTLWFNSSQGIHDRYDPKKDGFVHLDHRIANYLNNDTILKAEIDGEIWFPSAEGLLRLLPPFSDISENWIVPDNTVIYKNILNDPSSLNSSWIRSICFSKNFESGTLWLATIGGGLNKMIRKQVEGTELYEIHFEHYTEENGLCDNNVLGILEDENGNLWLSTLNGLSRFDPRTGVFNNFYEIDGLPTNHFTWSDPCQSSDGEMFFPTESGVLTFHPDSIQLNREIPPVLITEFKIFNKAVYPGEDSPLKQNICFAQSAELNYNQNFISMEYAALNYEQTEKNQYKYMMEGLDPNWINAGTRQYVEYPGLKPGRYVFRVQGSNNNGIWNMEGASLELIIHPPPWRTAAAYLLYGVIIIGIIFWYRRILMNKAQLKTAVEIERLEKEKIKAIDSFRSRFFTNISHEFRTPLSLVLGPVRDGLKTNNKEIISDRSVFEMIRRNAERLQQLINQLLDISKLETSKMRLQVSEGDIVEFLKPIIFSFTSLAESKQIKYSYDLPGIAEKVFFDGDKVEKIITNLLSNAFKFTPGGKKIEFLLRFESADNDGKLKNVHLRLSDTGIGVSRKNLDHIFDRFYQANNSDTRDAEGTGIGLAITKELIDLYRGEIHVESEYGKGSSFLVKLPISKEQFREEEIINIEDKGIHGIESDVDNISDPSEHETEVFQVSKDIENKADRPIILIVEDNADLRKYISHNLEDSYRILTGHNGKDGMKHAIEYIPDLVISDVMMPVMDGIEMCRRLKEDERTSHIPVIMLTAKADRESKMEGLETGIDDYIIKPFDREELQVRVRNLIEQRKRLREKFRKEFMIDRGDTEGPPSDLFLEKIMQILNQHISEAEFTMDHLADELQMSRTQMFRKISSIIGTTPNELLRMVRMKQSAVHLESGSLNITQIMYEVGLRNMSHFASSFKKYYGVTPSEFKNSL